MPKTKQISFECSEATIVPGSYNSFGVVGVVAKNPLLKEMLDCIDRSELIEYIQERCTPEDVFTRSRLIDWAIDEGYISIDDE